MLSWLYIMSGYLTFLFYENEAQLSINSGAIRDFFFLIWVMPMLWYYFIYRLLISPIGRGDQNRFASAQSKGKNTNLFWPFDNWVKWSSQRHWNPESYRNETELINLWELEDILACKSWQEQFSDENPTCFALNLPFQPDFLSRKNCSIASSPPPWWINNANLNP